MLVVYCLPLVNFTSLFKLFRISKKIVGVIMLSSKMIKQSFKKRSQFLSISSLLVRLNLSSILLYRLYSKKPITIVAYVGAKIVPIAVPICCKKFSPLNSNVLFFRTKLVASKMNSFVNLGFIVFGNFSMK